MIQALAPILSSRTVCNDDLNTNSSQSPQKEYHGHDEDQNVLDINARSEDLGVDNLVFAPTKGKAYG